MAGEGGGGLGPLSFVEMLGGVNRVITREPEKDGEEKLSGTPLWWAARAVCYGKAGGLELAKLLIEGGAAVDAVGKLGAFECRPLWWAANAVCNGSAGGLELAKLLIEGGAAVDADGKDGDVESTPLRFLAEAVKNSRDGAPDLLRLFVSKGATLLPSERAEWQQYVDATTRNLANRFKSRGCFIGVPGSRQAKAGTVRADEHLPGVSNDLDLAMGHWGNRSDWSMYKTRTKKQEALEHIEGYLNVDARDDPEADTFVLQYSGHGARGSGDWCMYDEGRVTFDEVMEKWEASEAKAKGCLLVLVLDSCHSGKWVERAKERNLMDVAVQAACGPDEVTFDKFFTQLLIRYHNGKLSKDEALTNSRTSYENSMHPCAYVPWRDTSVPLSCGKTKKEFRMLTVE